MKPISESYIEYKKKIWILREEPLRWFMPYGLLLLLAFLALMLLAGFYVAERIEEQISNDVRQVFKDESMPWVKVEADGQNLALSGIAPNAAAAQKALEVAAKLKSSTFFGAFASTVDISSDFSRSAVKVSPAKTMPEKIIAKARHYDWKIQRNEKEVILSGVVANKLMKQQVYVNAQRIFPGIKVVNKLTLQDGVHYKDFLVESISLLEMLNQGAKGTAQMQQGVSSLKLEVKNNAIKTAVVKEFAELHKKTQNYKKGEFLVIVTEAADLCDQKLAKLLKQQQIRFETAKAMISSSSRSLLKSIAEVAISCEGDFQIAGHTDSIGEEAMNLELSQARADAVKNALVLLGLEGKRLTAVGFGETKPIGDNTNALGRAMNRRIEIKVIR